ncbi:TPA: hypothetical protein ACGOY9_000330 [Streptococcus suis]
MRTELSPFMYIGFKLFLAVLAEMLHLAFSSYIPFVPIPPLHATFFTTKPFIIHFTFYLK